MGSETSRVSVRVTLWFIYVRDLHRARRPTASGPRHPTKVLGFILTVRKNRIDTRLADLVEVRGCNVQLSIYNHLYQNGYWGACIFCSNRQLVHKETCTGKTCTVHTHIHLYTYVHLDSHRSSLYTVLLAELSNSCTRVCLVWFTSSQRCDYSSW